MTENQLPVRPVPPSPSSRSSSARNLARRSGTTSPRSASTRSPKPQTIISGFMSTRNEPHRAPLGSTIAHGLFSLSLGPQFSYQLIHFDGFAHSLNYGYDKVRFPAPVPVGSRVRMRATVVSAEQLPGGIQVKMSQVVEREGSDKPVVVAESVARVVEKS